MGGGLWDAVRAARPALSTLSIVPLPLTLPAGPSIVTVYGCTVGGVRKRLARSRRRGMLDGRVFFVPSGGRCIISHRLLLPRCRAPGEWWNHTSAGELGVFGRAGRERGETREE